MAKTGKTWKSYQKEMGYYNYSFTDIELKNNVVCAVANGYSKPMVVMIKR